MRRVMLSADPLKVTMLMKMCIFIVMISLQLWLQWFWLLLYAALIIPFAPWQSVPMRFYRCVMITIPLPCRSALRRDIITHLSAS